MITENQSVLENSSRSLNWNMRLSTEGSASVAPTYMAASS